MRKSLVTLVSLAALVSASAALAQTLPPDPATQNAQTQAQLNAQIQQTQQNNLATQQSLQQNQMRQQQLFNTMPPAGFMQNQFSPSPPPGATP